MGRVSKAKGKAQTTINKAWAAGPGEAQSLRAENLSQGSKITLVSSLRTVIRKGQSVLLSSGQEVLANAIRQKDRRGLPNRKEGRVPHPAFMLVLVKLLGHLSRATGQSISNTGSQVKDSKPIPY